MAPVFVIAFLGVLCLAMAGFCVWKLGESAERHQKALEKEQNYRFAEREAAFRREKFLITVLLKNDPQLANTLSKIPAEEQQMPDIELGMLKGYGEALLSRRPL